METRWAILSEKALGAFKYLLSGYMMLAGIVTSLGPPVDVSGPLTFLYTSRISLLLFGLIFFLSGLALLYGKIRKSRRWTGHGLFAIYMCFTFFAALNYVAIGELTSWIGNLIAAVVVGSLWLRWRFKTQYINPNHFIRDIEELS